jgi:hypothetical protein
LKTINNIQTAAAGLVMKRSEAKPKEAKTQALPEKVR